MVNDHQSNEKIMHVSQFIERVNALINSHTDKKVHFLYRGECKKYPNFCRPNIFRKNVLSTNPLYEKSLFNTMRQNKLSNNESYLENAIDAQHGEFPSRLLDVSYNCLTALYFAVTPYYHKDITEYDEDDGMVYVFFIDEIFSPSAQNTNDNYNAIIDKECPWFNNHAIFQKNHKFIDHTKINNRIIAQQGAFILFQGNDDEKIPSYMMGGIVIPKEAKPMIRNELSVMFGINTGSVYPEIVNVAEDLVNKSKSLVTEPFSWKNEIKYVLNNLEKELSYYAEQLSSHNTTKDSEYYDMIQTVEMIINSYRIGIIDFLQDFKSCKYSGSEQDAHDEKIKIIDRYNSIVTKAIKDINTDCGTQLSADLIIPKKESESK